MLSDTTMLENDKGLWIEYIYVNLYGAIFPDNKSCSVHGAYMLRIF